MLVVDLFEQVLNIALDSVIVHVRENGLDRLRLCELVELMAAVHTGKLKDKRESNRWVALHDILNIISLPIDL